MRMIITSGNITVNPTVKQINATLLPQTFIAGGTSPEALKINGSIYAVNNVTLNRSFTPKSDNNQTPAVQVTYDPGIIFKMPKEVAKTVTQWRLN